jgi:ketol-acid reductoisomerase
MVGGSRIVTDETRAEMRRILAEVREGRFTREFVDQAAAGHSRMNAWGEAGAVHPIEDVRQRMSKLSPG